LKEKVNAKTHAALSTKDTEKKRWGYKRRRRKREERRKRGT